MKVLGVDLDMQFGDKNGSMSICTVDNGDGTNRVVDMHVGEIGYNFDKICDTLISIFEVNNCDFIALNTGGVVLPVAAKLKEKLGDKLKDEYFDRIKNTEMFSMLEKDKTLNRLGLKLKLRSIGGFIGLDTDEYEDFEIKMVYAIALANRILNKESINMNKEKEELIKQLNKAKQTVDEIKNKLEELNLNE